jgi:sterol 3beta-glucosyltransferase
MPTVGPPEQENVMRITMLTTGTRGDVQPYVALGVGLQRAGHHVRVPAPELFRGLITESGLDFRPIRLELNGVEIQSPQELLHLPEVHAAMQGGKRIRLFGLLAFARFVKRHMADYVAAYFDACWASSEDADLLIASTVSSGGPDFAEKLGIPCISAAIQPVTPTCAFPSPLLAPRDVRLNHAVNRLTYHVLRMFSWLMQGKPTNKWRREMGLAPHSSLSYWRQVQAQTTIYGFSPSVLPTPADWPPNHHVTGYWFSDEPTGWQPPAHLVRFLENGPPPVYVGFGSMPGDDMMRVARVVLEALRLSNQRGVLLSGWGELSGSLSLPETTCSLETVPHSWLFPRMRAVVHHGGMGTTAAGLRAGIPSVIIPAGADQPFWAQRVEQLGVGVHCASFSKVTADQLAAALREVTTDTALRQRAAALGERISAEDGVGQAVAVIQNCLRER